MKRALAIAILLAAIPANAGPGNAQEAVDLRSYAGRYPWDPVEGVPFFDNPAVKGAVTAAVADADIRQAVLAETGGGRAVSFPMVAVGDRLYMNAFDAASAGDTSWGLLISADGTDAAVCFSTFVEAGTKEEGGSGSSIRSSWYADGEVFLTGKFPCPANDEIEDAAQYRVLPALATARGALQHERCFGVLSTGSGMAGSSITGDGACFISADSEVQDLVTHGCGEGDICLVEAMVEVARDDGRNLIREVLSVNRVVEEPQAAGSYLQQVGGFFDGVYADGEDGCDMPAASANERVSIHLSRKAGPAIQLRDLYCAVTDATGDAPTPEGFQSTFQIRCGASPDEDAALRSGAAGSPDTIRLGASNTREISLQGTATLLRCPIRPSYTPQWWMSEPPSNVLLMDY
ncbi:hypothetical protein [Nitratireductor sp. ZSWI3]|uniref:hypothetical protein n=1 Tax=Nitratireductor sp. ZSWI3 TaxID=2966359 RepID=UPI0021506497|nr:hypothetical protein [Nitratireductor sp. ZSWI3]MCR4266552.1 hypothetical protein [Nitratireductor sp. ZSWI3]